MTVSATKGLSRRRFLRLAGAGLAGLTLLDAAGCGGEERREGPVELVFSHGPDASGIFQEQIDRFNREHRGEIRVKYRKMPTDTDQYFELLATEFRAGGTPADIISGDVTWSAQFAANGWIVDLSDRFPEEERRRHLDGPIQANTYEGAIWGVPWFTDAGMLYYRKDLLEQAGFSEPPQTWEKLKEQAKTVKQRSGLEHGFVFQGAEYEGGVVNGLEYIWTAGGDVLDGDKILIAGPGALEGLRIERGMVEDGVAPEAVSSYKELEAYMDFLGGKAVFMRNWPFVYGLASDPQQSSIEPERIGVASLPTAQKGYLSVSGLGGWNLMVNATTEPREAVWTFIRYMSAPEQQKLRALRGGYLPTLKSLYEDREVRNAVPVISLGREALQNARSRPVSPAYSEMSLIMAARLNALLRGAATPKKTVEILQEELTSIVR